ncbi:hypothetical protein [Nocardioides marmorisolisilvae]|uniref:ARB-07466-like C-terminal domain-containing protein n=1 Tax=Nocardioides marmorisolisilvae TaxID=1542737 RepID=A0A3N0DVT8_9ACTN|nr:hypothetical protein [Nocardioides marmorisolisilvae]RNL79681.1 hypothetical protein EFL95_12010 [Nocardioides marmorisolisilvae]
MTRGNHSLKPRGSKTRRLAVISAPLVTCAVVGVGVAISDGAISTVDLSSRYSAADVSAALGPRTNGVSRDSDRTSSIGAVVSAATLPQARGRRWTTTKVDLRTAPSRYAAVHSEVSALKRLSVTGLHRNGFSQVLVGRQAFWVTSKFLATKKPVVVAAMKVVGKPCPAHSSTENGLTPQAITVFRAVCNAFPQITSYGGYSPHGEHSSGKAIDIMTTDVTLGTQIAEFLRAHAAELNLFDVIWRRHIFTPERAGEGWRLMPSRGSANADHMNHVHVSVN